MPYMEEHLPPLSSILTPAGTLSRPVLIASNATSSDTGVGVHLCTEHALVKERTGEVCNRLRHSHKAMLNTQIIHNEPLCNDIHTNARDTHRYSRHRDIRGRPSQVYRILDCDHDRKMSCTMR